MFNEIPGGTCIDIQLLPCWIPPVGFVWDYEESKWIETGVHKRRTKFEDCFWEIDPRFGKYLKWKEEQDAKQEQDPGFEHAELSRFIADCWRWRLSGMWFYIGKTAVYITGVHWYYLSCYYLERDRLEGLPEYAQDMPDYREEDRKIFYVWDYVDEGPWCLGMNLVMKRRGGKTSISACIALEKATRRRAFKVGIQSKTDDDARDLFAKAIIEPFRRLPYFFSAVSDIPRDKTPAKALHLKSGKMSTDVVGELGSRIDYRPSSVKSYDGQRLGFYIDDECGKTEIVDVQKRWNVVKNCLLDNTKKVVGKSIHTTTVDEMEAGGSAFKRIWDASRQSELNSLGRTRSGLVNYFVPADVMGEADKYGFPYKEQNLREILAERESETDPRSLAALKRQFPLDEREAFSADSSSCAFSNIDGLNNQLDTLKYMPKRYVTGNFMWVDGVPDTTVEFVECDNGKFQIVWQPDEEHRNLKIHRFGVWHPLNTDMACGGCDPYNHRMLSVEGQKAMSKGSIVFIKKPNVLAPSDIDEGPCLFYMTRPADPNIFYEDVIMACVYYGCQILIEDNKDKCMDWFQDRGYAGYLAWLPGRNKPGISSSGNAGGGGTAPQIATLTDSYLTHYVETCYYQKLIEQWLDFDVTQTTKFDGAMAFGFAKILQKSSNIGFNRPKSDKGTDIKDIMPASMFVKGSKSMFR